MKRTSGGHYHESRGLARVLEPASDQKELGRGRHLVEVRPEGRPAQAQVAERDLQAGWWERDSC